MNTLKKIAACAIFCWASAPAFAQKPPSYDEAVKFLRQLEKPVSETGIWHQKPPAARIKAAQDATALVKRAEALFGTDVFAYPRASCLQAANMAWEYVQNLNQIAHASERGDRLDPVTPLNMTRTGVVFGEHKTRCYDHIETLDTPKKK